METKAEKPPQDRFDYPLRDAHPYYMYENIHATPVVLERCLSDESLGQLAEIAAEVKRRGLDHVYFVGCGTSLNEGKTVSYYVEEEAGLPAKAIDSLEFTGFPPPNLGEKSCVITISHSGNSITTIHAARFARSRGAYVISMVGRPDGRLATEGDVAILDPGGRELNGPKMRSYIVTCFQGLLLSSLIGSKHTPESLKALYGTLPQAYRQSIEKMEPIAKEIAKDWAKTVDCYFVAGSGPEAGHAYELALKLLETVFVPSMGFDIEELTHGPLYALTPQRVVILLQSDARGKARLVEAAYAINAVTDRILVITEDPQAGWPGSARVVPLDVAQQPLNYLLSPVLMQLVCYYLVLEYGTNPDRSNAHSPALQEMSSRSFPPGTH